MSNPDGVLAAIDACLDDYELSDDAMRWAPGEPDATPEDGLALWGEYLNGDRLYRTTTPPYEFVMRHGAPLVAPDVLQRLAVSPCVDGSAFVAIVRAAETALEGFGKAFGPVLSATAREMHRAAHRDDRAHYRHCPTCNPRGFPKPLPINGHEYHRRQSRRNRR